MSYAESNSSDTKDRGPMTLWRSAGVLAIIGGAALGAVLLLQAVAGNFRLGSFPYLLATGLAIAGGALALQGKRAIAPWLILAATIIHWIYRLGGGLLYLPDEFRFLLLQVSLLALPIAAVLAIIAFVKTPARSRSASLAAVAVSSVGQVASVGEDGTVAADWYADPDGKPAERFWDGSEWTERTRPVTTATAQAITGVMSKPTVTPTGEPISPNSRAAAAILCWFFGILGIHRFYVGKVGTGLVMLFTLGGLGIWTLIDFIWILVGTFKDKSERVLANW